MNVKAGQWLRSKTKLYQIKEIQQELKEFHKSCTHCVRNYYFNIHLKKDVSWVLKSFNITKVANTPQELIQVGDLVKYYDYVDRFIKENNH